MSGVNRAIIAEVQASGGDVVAAFQPAAIRAETGRAMGVKGADNDKYTGKNA